ncbi:Cyclin-dependent kinase 15, partial [Ophiophagus hannah]
MGDILCGNFSSPRCLCCHCEEKDSSQQDNIPPKGELKPKKSLPFGYASSYLTLETLSEGPHSVVCQGISRIYNQLVALKVISLNTEEGIPFTAIREVSLLKSLKHANIVLLHDIFQTKESLTLVFEYMHTDLAQYMSQHPGSLHPHNVMLFMFQLLRGLAHIHKCHILHRDLKPQNLLLNCYGELKLADFGLARAKSLPNQTYSAEVVTLGYRPPDVLLGATDYSSDVLGIPTEETWPELSKLCHYKPDRFLDSWPQGLQMICDRLIKVPEAEDLAGRMLKVRPQNRISAQQALFHRFFNPLPSQLSQLSDAQSIFSVPGVMLKQEMCDLFLSSQKGHQENSSSKFW